MTRPVAVAILLAVFAATIAVALLAGFIAKASAHEAPAGWTYPYSCCSGQDCREVAA